MTGEMNCAGCKVDLSYNDGTGQLNGETFGVLCPASSYRGTVYFSLECNTDHKVCARHIVQKLLRDMESDRG